MPSPPRSKFSISTVAGTFRGAGPGKGTGAAEAAAANIAAVLGIPVVVAASVIANIKRQAVKKDVMREWNELFDLILVLRGE
jgi:hypothetical protein